MSERPDPVPSPRLQADIVAALRGDAPGEGARLEDLDRAFRRYECGGWLHARWRVNAPGGLPEAWRTAAATAHRRTLVDTLMALAGLKEVGALIAGAGAPFILLKGAAYLAEFYADAGERALTDVDLLVPRDRLTMVARRLAQAGFRGATGPDYPEDCRFEMYREGPAACRFELHWRVGSARRMHFDQDALWRRARETTLEGIPCRILAPDDALLFHVGHAADHYFGPTLKWALDLREMIRTWKPDPGTLVARATAAGLRTSLHIALVQLETLMPGAVARGLLQATAIGPARRAVLRGARSPGPAEFLRLGPGDLARMAVRPFLFDTAGDAAAVAATVLLRPAARLRRRAAGRAALPWEPGAVLD